MFYPSFSVPIKHLCFSRKLSECVFAIGLNISRDFLHILAKNILNNDLSNRVYLCNSNFWAVLKVVCMSSI